MKQKLELLNHLGCHYIINQVMYRKLTEKVVSADLFIGSDSYAVTIHYGILGNANVQATDPAAINAINELKKKRSADISSFYKKKCLYAVLELIILIECLRNMYINISYQFYYQEFNIIRTILVAVCISILYAIYRLNLHIKHT